MTSATESGTARYRDRFGKAAAAGHFRLAQGRWLSSLGLGSYLGEADARTDEAYRHAVRRAAELGCNVFDTAANYRCQRSERSFGEAFAELFAGGKLAREELVVTTKGGYIPFDGQQPRSRQEMTAYIEETFIRPGVCTREDFVQGSHCMTPRYLAHQLDQSLRNLRLDCVDGYYLHNPESQLAEVTPDEFYRRLHAAFEFLESAVEDGRIAMYGTATWNGYRAPATSPEHLSLERMVETARVVAGDGHHFKIVQLPFNLAMPEALAESNQSLGPNRVALLEAAAELGVTVMSSATILQSRLAAGLPPALRDAFKDLRTDAQRAIQFARSAPGLATALVGMSHIAHVEENLELACVAPLSEASYWQVFGG
jgi:aryl-alcohol dehydrogenase-like predicted oxidoreductase